MEIPKNTTQIGEIHGNLRIFIEDYVVSYMKQLCRQEPDRKKRIALYGVKRMEEPQQYFFVYGGSEVERYAKDDLNLLKQDYEEITWKGECYFEDYVPLGFVTIEDELPEGVFLFNEGKEIYIRGYHIFYEKNESMLTFLIHRQSEESNDKTEAEQIPEEKMLPQSRKTEQEYIAGPARRLMNEKKQEAAPEGEVKVFGIVKSLTAALFIVLCVTAFSTMSGSGTLAGLQDYFGQAIQAMKEKKIPDREDVAVMTSKNIDVTIPQEAELPQEVEIPKEAETPQKMETLQETETPQKIADLQEMVPPEIIEPQQETVSENTVEVSEPEPETVVEAEAPLTHIIQSGETLISISKLYYGNDTMVSAICELNGIANSDNIQVGQKIILP